MAQFAYGHPSWRMVMGTDVRQAQGYCAQSLNAMAGDHLARGWAGLPTDAVQ